MTLFLKKHNIALLLSLLLMLVLFPLRASAEDYSCTAYIPVRVNLTGEIDTEFVVQISSEEGAPLPEEDVLKIRGSGNAAFGAITYTEPGDYHYTVVQQSGEIPYLTYDNTVYRVTVRVTNNEEGGLTPEIWAVKDDQTEKTAELVFENVYTPPTPVPSPDSNDNHKETSDDVVQPSSMPLQQFRIPQTSDRFPLLVLIVVMCVAVVGFGYSYFRKNKQKKNGSDRPSDSAE